MAPGYLAKSGTLDALKAENGRGARVWSPDRSSMGEDRFDVLLVGLRQRFLVASPGRAGEEAHRLKTALSGSHSFHGVSAEGEVSV